MSKFLTYKNLLRIVTHSSTICLYSLIITTTSLGGTVMADAAVKTRPEEIANVKVPTTSQASPGKLKVFGAMIEDIMTNPRRGALASEFDESVNHVETGRTYRPGVNTRFLEGMREMAQNGWLGDPARLELSGMGLDGRETISKNMTFARWLTQKAAYASNQQTPPDIIDLGGGDKLQNTRPRAVYYNYLYAHTDPEAYLPRDASGNPMKIEDFVAVARVKVADDILQRDIEPCAKNEPQVTVQRCAQVGASMGLRDQADTGVRYDDIKLVVAPKTPKAGNTGSMESGKPKVVT
jgi:hypothetical protein